MNLLMIGQGDTVLLCIRFECHEVCDRHVLTAPPCAQERSCSNLRLPPKTVSIGCPGHSVP